MTDSMLVLRKLSVLRDHLGRVQRRRPADEGWGVVARYIVGLRNRIAHGYASLDPQRLWTELPDGISALERFAEAIARFIPPQA